VTVKFVQPHVTETAARKHFERRRFGNLFGLLRRRSSVSPSGKTLPHIELVWLPQYLITLNVTARRGPGQITVSVDAHAGAFAIIDLQGALAEGDVEGEAFPPKMGEEEAVEIGRKQLQRSIMKRRGQRHKPVVEDLAHVEVFHYPYWVYYYERRRGYLDIVVRDAATGEKTGSRPKVAVVEALAAASKRKHGTMTA
jgi:hypothetical protein